MRTTNRRWARVALILLATVVLGAVLAIVKGRDSGLGYFVGNLSMPYLVAAFLTGRAVQRRWVACVLGVLATWATLGAFYLSAELVFGYPTGTMTRYYLEWFVAGTLSGSVLGLLGHESRCRARLRFVLPLALVLEPFAVVAVQLAGRFGGIDLQPLQLLTWSCEVLLGVLAVGLTARRRVR